MTRRGGRYGSHACYLAPFHLPRLWYLRGELLQQRSHGVGRAGSEGCNVCGCLNRKLLHEVFWEQDYYPLSHPESKAGCNLKLGSSWSDWFGLWV